MILVMSGVALTCCSLTTDTNGLVDAGNTATDGAVKLDAGLGDVAVVTEAATESGPATCACPDGATPGPNPGECKVEQTSDHRSCTGPIVASPCPLKYLVTLCATDPTFAFDTQCAAGPRQAAFFSLLDNPLGRWNLEASGIDSIGRASESPVCSKTVPKCGSSSSATANLASGGAPMVLGKLITAGCTTLTVKIEPTSETQ